MNEVETFTVTVEVKLADIDGQPIREGSVLQEVGGRDVGVVVRIIRKTDTHGPMASAVGDMLISMGHGVTRVTNRYKNWRHVPHDDQSYDHRLQSWMHQKYEHDEDRSISRDEGLAIDGIMNLLPSTLVNWEMGPWPDSLEDALNFLSEFLQSQSK